MLQLEEKEIMAFKDESGEKVEFEIVAKLKVDNKDYMILAPLDGMRRMPLPLS